MAGTFHTRHICESKKDTTQQQITLKSTQKYTKAYSAHQLSQKPTDTYQVLSLTINLNLVLVLVPY